MVTAGSPPGRDRTGTPPRLCRSLLYLPGANARALEKARILPADGLIFDLEDSVAADAKRDARERVRAAVASGGYGHRQLVIRTNGIDTPWFANDVAAVADAVPDALLAPKVESVAQVRHIEQALIAAGASERTRIWVMIESPTGVLDARAILSGTDRLDAVVVGTNDLAKDLDAAHVPGRAPLLTSLSLLVLAARAAGKVIVDSVHGDLDDPDGFEAECRQARDHGFDGKSLIHPRQLEVCNRVFAPDDAAVAQARRMITAFEAALADGRGVVMFEGRMVEGLHVEQARTLIARAEQIAATTG